MTLHLYWLDKNWKSKGEANHYNLVVDLEDGTYEVYINSFCGYTNLNDIEVRRKSDIMDYIKHLKAEGFKDIST